MQTPFLNDRVLSQLDKFNLRARLIVEGFLIGLHKSPYHGFSVEFSDHRQYNPGDSLRNLDWRVFARTERYYVKRYEEETNLKAYLLIDHSASMGYSSGDVTKLDWAKAFTSALAYLMVSQQDAAGLLSYTDHITHYLPPRAVKSYLNEIWRELAQLKPEDRTQTPEVLHSLADRIKQRGLIIIVSDLLDDPEAVIRGLQHFRHQKHEVILFHVQDFEEKEFSFDRETQFIDAETGEKLTVHPYQIRGEYREEYGKFVEELRHRCYENRIEYNPVTTSTPFDEALFQYLVKRSKLL
jgi:uncharacterized protein (DUF58 family)